LNRSKKTRNQSRDCGRQALTGSRKQSGGFRTVSKESSKELFDTALAGFFILLASKRNFPGRSRKQPARREEAVSFASRLSAAPAAAIRKPPVHSPPPREIEPPY